MEVHRSGRVEEVRKVTSARLKRCLTGSARRTKCMSRRLLYHATMSSSAASGHFSRLDMSA
jgi:hypothetical protein